MLIADDCESTADILLVRISPAAVVSLRPESYSCADTGGDALGLLRLLRFQLLVASLDVPDMQPWELFARARRMQSQLRCVLLDERMTSDDECRVRQTGAAAFASSDPAICAALVRSWPRGRRHDQTVSTQPKGPATAPT
jgi:DNA-binding NarL/FixJ family response regulator